MPSQKRSVVFPLKPLINYFLFISRCFYCLFCLSFISGGEKTTQLARVGAILASASCSIGNALLKFCQSNVTPCEMTSTLVICWRRQNTAMSRQFSQFVGLVNKFHVLFWQLSNCFRSLGSRQGLSAFSMYSLELRVNFDHDKRMLIIKWRAERWVAFRCKPRAFLHRSRLSCRDFQLSAVQKKTFDLNDNWSIK